MRKTILAALIGLLTGAGLLVAWVTLPFPVPRSPLPGLTLEDRNGVVLRTTRAGDGSRSDWTPLGEMDPQLIQAFVAVEDRRFYRHVGVDLVAIARAALTDLEGRHLVSGASTISMQLARLLRVPGHGWFDKSAQALWALRLERHLTKQQILEQYLNRVPLGQGAIGVAAATALYFNAAPDRVSTGQAALLAGLARSPSTDNPFVSPDRARRRRAAALSRMRAEGFISADADLRAMAEPVAIPRTNAPFLAPHFTTYLLTRLDDSAANLSRLPSPASLRSSLDIALQSDLEGEVRHTVALLGDREVRQAAAVVLDNHTGEVLAWVGSPDFWSDTSGQVDMVVSPRQPGSALKPFLYGLAFDRGVTAATVLPDSPITYQTSSGPYQPRNYDRRWHGPVRAREALASSFNVPAVELADRVGPPALLHTLRAAGFASLDHSAEYYGLGMALGDGDVSLLELANAYRGLANGGAWRPWSWRRADGQTARRADGQRFVSRGAALLVLDILADPVARIPGFGTDTPFDLPFPVAVKTGTSRHYTDNWAVGVAGNFTVAVWAGNFSGRPMRQVSGVTGAGPLLHRALLDVAKRYAPGVLPTPDAVGATRVRICCPATDEWFLPGTAPAPSQLASSTPARDSFAILSPLEGDKYEIPPGIDPRFATIPLRASSSPVHWFVDGKPAPTARWQLSSGHHAIRAVGTTGQSAEVAIEVR